MLWQQVLFFHIGLDNGRYSNNIGALIRSLSTGMKYDNIILVVYTQQYVGL